MVIDGASTQPRPTGIAALILSLAIVLIAATWYQANALDRATTYLQSTATTGDPVTWGDLTFQRAALRDPSTMVVYGSSESLCPCGLPYLAGYYFRNGPTGFSVYAVGTGAMSDLIFAQTLAALGPHLTGRKIILSTPWERFRDPKGMASDAYRNLFRPEMADGLIFDSSLPLDLRQDAARRMLSYPETVADEPVLRAAMNALNHGSFLDIIAYDALKPVGWVNSYVRQIQDARDTNAFIDAHFWYRQNSPLLSASPNWQSLLADGTQRALDQVSNNPFGWWNVFEDQNGASLNIIEATARYCATVGSPTPPVLQDNSSSAMLTSPEWVDLDLAMRITHYFGADALALSYPMPGYWFDFIKDIPPNDRAAFVQKFDAFGARDGVPTLALPEFDYDRLFLAEPLTHLSPRGAVLIDRVFDLFWHGQSPSEIQPALDQLAKDVPTSPFPPQSAWYCQ